MHGFVNFNYPQNEIVHVPLVLGIGRGVGGAIRGSFVMIEDGKDCGICVVVWPCFMRILYVTETSMCMYQFCSVRLLYIHCRYCYGGIALLTAVGQMCSVQQK